MEIKLEINKNIKQLDLGKVNLIIGKNNSGKTRLLTNISDSLEGETEFALINGIVPSKTLFEIINIDETRDLEDDITLKSQSYFNKEIIKDFLILNEEELEESSNTFLMAVEKLFQKNNLTSFNYALSNNIIKLEPEKLNKLASIIFKLHMSQKGIAAKEEFFIRQRLETIPTETHVVILIDNVDRYLDYEVIKKIIEIICQKENTTIIMSTNKREIMREIEFEAIYTTEGNRIDIIEESKYRLFNEYLTKENINMKLDDYILENEDLFLQEDFQKYYQENKDKIISSIKF